MYTSLNVNFNDLIIQQIPAYYKNPYDKIPFLSAQT